MDEDNDIDYYSDYDYGTGNDWAIFDMLNINFCSDPLWSAFEENNSTNSSSSLPQFLRDFPTFTTCFQHSILSLIPVLFFLFCFPVILVQTRRRKKYNDGIPTYPIKWNNLASMIHAVTTTLTSLAIFFLLKSLYDSIWENEDVPLIDYIYPLLQTGTLFGILWASEAYRRSGIVSPGPLFCIWLLFVLSGAPEFIDWIQQGTDPALVNQLDFFRYLAYLIWYPLCVIQLFLHCFASGRTTARIFDPMESPENKVSFINRQFYVWMDKLIRRGYQKALTVEDIYRMDEAMETRNLYRMWTYEWNIELFRCKLIRPFHR